MFPILNFLAQKEGLECDFGGGLAQKGRRIDPLFEALEILDFYTKLPPKSLGIEWVNATLFPLLKKYDTHPTEDVLHTYTLHIGKQIGACFDSQQKVLASGGGVMNDYLMYQIRKHTAARIHIPSSDIINFNQSSNKSINHISESGNTLYLSTPFAIVEYDIEKLEFGDTFFIGNGSLSLAINKTVIQDSKIYAATEDGLFTADVTSNLLIDFNNWTQEFSGRNFSNIESFNNQI